MMKILLPLCSALLITSSLNQAIAGDTASVIDAFKNGEFSLAARAFYFNRSFDKPATPDSEALTLGGIAKYQTGTFHNSRLGLAYYGSHSLSFLVDRDDGKASALLETDGDDIMLLGEAYLDYNRDVHQLQIGRQRLPTPLMNDHDLRMLPSSYEAIVYRNRSLKDTLLEFAYVNSYTGFASRLGKFDEQVGDWGDDGLAYVFGETKLNNISLRGQYIGTLEDSGTFAGYSYLDATFPIEIGTKTYLSAQYAGTDYQAQQDATMLGLKLGTSVGPFELSALYNQIRDNAFRTVESGIMYTDLQQGYGPYDPSQAWGVQVMYRHNENASLRLAHVDITSDDLGVYKIDQFTETNLDAIYKINKSMTARLRYSIKDQDQRTTREDRDDLRLILYANW